MDWSFFLRGSNRIHQTHTHRCVWETHTQCNITAGILHMIVIKWWSNDDDQNQTHLGYDNFNNNNNNKKNGCPNLCKYKFSLFFGWGRERYLLCKHKRTYIEGWNKITYLRKMYMDSSIFFKWREWIRFCYEWWWPALDRLFLKKILNT